MNSEHSRFIDRHRLRGQSRRLIPSLHARRGNAPVPVFAADVGLIDFNYAAQQGIWIPMSIDPHFFQKEKGRTKGPTLQCALAFTTSASLKHNCRRDPQETSQLHPFVHPYAVNHGNRTLPHPPFPVNRKTHLHKNTERCRMPANF